jgi:hypothetical protein
MFNFGRLPVIWPVGATDAGSFLLQPVILLQAKNCVRAFVTARAGTAFPDSLTSPRASSAQAP